MVGQYLPQTNGKYYSVLQDFFQLYSVFYMETKHSPYHMWHGPALTNCLYSRPVPIRRIVCPPHSEFQIPLHQGLTEPSCGGALHSSSWPWSLEFQLQQVDKAHGLMMHALMPISPSDSLHWVFFFKKRRDSQSISTLWRVLIWYILLNSRHKSHEYCTCVVLACICFQSKSFLDDQPQLSWCPTGLTNDTSWNCNWKSWKKSAMKK